MKAFEATVARPLEDVEADVRAALSEEGFGVLTEIDVAATLATKLGVERPKLRILGACNPVLAHRALEVEPSVSLLLPCNVVIEEVPSGTRVAIVDPTELLDVASLRELASDAAARLQRVVDRVSAR